MTDHLLWLMYTNIYIYIYIKGCRPCRRPRRKKEVCRRRDDIWPSRFQNFAASRASFAALGALGTLVTLNGTIQFVSQDGDM